MLMDRAGIGKTKNQPISTHKKWGKMLVIFDGDISITLGPDCTHLYYSDWCFIPTFLCFFGVSLGVIFLVLSNA